MKHRELGGSQSRLLYVGASLATAQKSIIKFYKELKLIY